MAIERSIVSALMAFISISSLFCSDAQKSGFSVELIYRDSPKSPFYNPNESPYERIVKAVERSATRVMHLDQNVHLDAAQAGMVANGGNYVMNISLGTPEVNIVGIADTGSDLIWTQCEPCSQCFKQVGPLFDPKKSKTYKDVACSSSKCKYLGRRSSCGPAKSCLYYMSYGDKSYSRGNLALDTVTLGSTDGRPVVLPNTIVGCGHNGQRLVKDKESGFIGLGQGPLSLISQLGKSIDGKFSYCLVPLSSTKSTKLNFGKNAVVSGNGAVSIPLLKGTPDIYYYINMRAISVNDKKIPYTAGPMSGTKGGNMIFDSGSAITYLPPEVYSKFEAAVTAAVVGKQIKSPSPVIRICYEESPGLKLPKITAHFDGVNLELKTMNAFVKVGQYGMCLAFAKADRLAVYGSIAHTNFLVGYDTAAKKLSFKPADCEKA